MRNTICLVCLTALAGLSSACFQSSGGSTFGNTRASGNAMSEAVPTTQDVALTLPADPAPNALTLGDTAIFYSATRGIARTANGLVFGLLTALGWVVSTPPSYATEGEAVWGPFTPALEPVTYLLHATRVGEGQYEYALYIRPRTSDSDDDFRAVMTGTHEVRSAVDGGEGELSIDWSAISEIDPHIQAEGDMVVTYDAAQTAWRSVEILLDGFRDHPGALRTNALYRYLENDDASGEFQFAYLEDVHHDVDRPLPELHEMRTRWVADGSGRSDARISSSEIGADLGVYLGLEQDYVEASECWDEGFLRTYYDENPLKLTPDDGELPPGGVNGPGQGDPGTCVFGDSLFADGDVTVVL